MALQNPRYHQMSSHYPPQGYYGQPSLPPQQGGHLQYNGNYHQQHAYAAQQLQAQNGYNGYNQYPQYYDGGHPAHHRKAGDWYISLLVCRI